MPKKGRSKGGELDPLKLPTRLQTALQALYGHYEKTFNLWQEHGIPVPPCFIIVCQNTAISKLVYDFISGFQRKNEDGTTTLENGRHHPGFHGPATHQGIARSVQSDRIDHARPLHDVEDAPVGDQPRTVPCQLGDWEAEFCRVAESHPQVRAYVKNQNLGLEVPYRYGSEMRKYIPDYIALVDDGHGDDDLLHLIVEIKGYRREDAKEKKTTMDTYWVPGVNNLGSYGRWGFAEFTDVYQIEADFKAKVESEFNKMIESATSPQSKGKR